MDTKIAYRASYIVEPIDHSLDAIRNRLMPSLAFVKLESVPSLV